MAKNYTELEAWAIFVGALVIGIVGTSVFWAYITIPENVKNIEKEIKNATEPVSLEKPDGFISFCKQVDGTPNWDSKGFRQCIVSDTSEKNIVLMNFLCKKFNLTLSYGSYGVKCERI